MRTIGNLMLSFLLLQSILDGDCWIDLINMSVFLSVVNIDDVLTCIYMLCSHIKFIFYYYVLTIYYYLKWKVIHYYLYEGNLSRSDYGSNTCRYTSTCSECCQTCWCKVPRSAASNYHNWGMFETFRLRAFGHKHEAGWLHVVLVDIGNHTSPFYAFLDVSNCFLIFILPGKPWDSFISKCFFVLFFFHQAFQWLSDSQDSVFSQKLS